MDYSLLKFIDFDAKRGFSGSLAKNRLTSAPENAKTPTVRPSAWKPIAGLMKILSTAPVRAMPKAVPTLLNAELSDIAVPLK